MLMSGQHTAFVGNIVCTRLLVGAAPGLTKDSRRAEESLGFGSTKSSETRQKFKLIRFQKHNESVSHL